MVNTTFKIARAAAVVIHDGNILVMSRDKFGKKYFVLPGGGIEHGETAA